MQLMRVERAIAKALEIVIDGSTNSPNAVIRNSQKLL